MSSDNILGYLQRSYLREKKARKEAEKVIEEKSRDLFFAYKDLEKLNMSLEQKVRKRTKELVKARTIAEESAKAKERFLANMSHEIRTPMNAILGFADLLKESDLNEQQRSYLSAIKHSSENLLVIINDILDFSKISAGKLSIEYVSVDIKSLISDLIFSFKVRAKVKNLNLDFQFDDNINQQLLSDPVRLQQILTNLISNAIKFTDSGKVALSCRVIEDTNKSQTLRFEVSDTGIGIDKDKLGFIYETFTQEDESITRKFGGSGLGLAISKQLVELLKGEMHVESVKGTGTIFGVTLELDKYQPKPCQSRLIPGEESYPLEGLKILLVEDNEFNQLLVESMLSDKKLIITSVLNGKEALMKLENQQFDIVLMDIQMPVMDGIEATQKIRNEMKLDVPIVALTANALKDDKEKYLNTGMDAYVSKPFEQQELFRVISELGGK